MSDNIREIKEGDTCYHIHYDDNTIPTLLIDKECREGKLYKVIMEQQAQIEQLQIKAQKHHENFDHKCREYNTLHTETIHLRNTLQAIRQADYSCDTAQDYMVTIQQIVNID